MHAAKLLYNYLQAEVTVMQSENYKIQQLGRILTF